MGSAHPLSRRSLIWHLIVLGLGLVWIVWTLIQLAAGNAADVEDSVAQAVDTARSLKSWPVQLLMASLLAFATYRLYRARRLIVLGFILIMVISVQLRRALDYSDRTLMIIVLIEVTAFMLADLVMLLRSLRASRNSTAAEQKRILGP